MFKIWFSKKWQRDMKARSKEDNWVMESLVKHLNNLKLLPKQLD